MEPIGTTEVTESVFNNKDIKKWINSCREDISKIEARIYSAIKEDRLSFDKMLNKSSAYRSVFCNLCDVNDLVSALQSYKWNIDRRVNDMIEYYIGRARSSSKDLFLESLFPEWCHGKDDMADKTAKLYISDIKRVNRDVLCNIGDDIFNSYLPDYVKTRNMSKIDEMFNAIDKKLTGLIDGTDETDMQRLEIINGRAAIKKYHQFIKSLISPDNE